MDDYHFEKKDNYLIPTSLSKKIAFTMKGKTLFGEDKNLFGSNNYMFSFDTNKGIKNIQIQDEENVDSDKQIEKQIDTSSKKIYEKEFAGYMTKREFDKGIADEFGKNKFMIKLNELAEKEKEKGTSAEVFNKKLKSKMAKNGRSLFIQALKNLREKRDKENSS